MENPKVYRQVKILPGPDKMCMCTSEQQTRFAESLGVIPKSVHRFRQGHDTITEAIEMQTNRVKMLHFIG